MASALERHCAALLLLRWLCVVPCTTAITQERWDSSEEGHSDEWHCFFLLCHCDLLLLTCYCDLLFKPPLQSVPKFGEWGEAWDSSEEGHPDEWRYCASSGATEEEAPREEVLRFPHPRQRPNFHLPSLWQQLKPHPPQDQRFSPGVPLYWPSHQQEGIPWRS